MIRTRIKNEKIVFNTNHAFKAWISVCSTESQGSEKLNFIKTTKHDEGTVCTLFHKKMLFILFVDNFWFFHRHVMKKWMEQARLGSNAMNGIIGYHFLNRIAIKQSQSNKGSSTETTSVVATRGRNALCP